MAAQPTEPVPTASPRPEPEFDIAAPHEKSAMPDGQERASSLSVAAARPWRLSHLMYLVAGIALFLWLCIELGPVIIVFAIVLAIAAAIGGAIVLARRRATRQDSLLWIMAIAAE